MEMARSRSIEEIIDDAEQLREGTPIIFPKDIKDWDLLREFYVIREREKKQEQEIRPTGKL